MKMPHTMDWKHCCCGWFALTIAISLVGCDATETASVTPPVLPAADDEDVGADERFGLDGDFGEDVDSDGPKRRPPMPQMPAASPRQRRLMQLTADIPNLVASGSPEKALAMLGDIEKEFGSGPEITMTRLAILEQSKTDEDLSDLRAEVVELAWGNPLRLNETAWNTALFGNGTGLELALRAALRAAELTNQDNAAILDTVARVHYEMGKLDEAITWQEKAVDIDGGQSDGISNTLVRYLAEKQAGPGDATPAGSEASSDTALASEGESEGSAANESSAANEDSSPTEAANLSESSKSGDDSQAKDTETNKSEDGSEAAETTDDSL